MTKTRIVALAAAMSLLAAPVVANAAAGKVGARINPAAKLSLSSAYSRIQNSETPASYASASDVPAAALVVGATLIVGGILVAVSKDDKGNFFFVPRSGA